MTWLLVLVVILLVASIFTLAISGAEPSRQIQTFSHSSPKEREFERRGVWLRAIGYTSVGLAALLGLVIVLKWLR